MEYKFIGIIPAIGKENLRKICGKPLVGWSIEAAQQARGLDEIVVLTDDKDIGAYARKLGCRYKTVKSKTYLPALREIYRSKSYGGDFDGVVILHPSNPIRIGDIIDRAINTFKNTRADSVATGYMCEDFKWGEVWKSYFINDWCVEVHRIETVLDEDKLKGARCVNLVVSECYNHRIKTKYDFIKVEALMKYIYKTYGVL